MNKYSVILFDMDGTIADTDDLIADGFLILYDEFKIKNRKTREELYKYSGPSIRLTLPIEFPGYDVDYLLERYRAVTKPIYDKDHLKAYPGEIETLKKLKQQGYKLGIVTNKVRSMSDLTLEVLDIADLFDCMVCLDEIEHAKPEKDGVEKVMKILKITDKSRLIYIGDNDIDYYTAANSGIDSMIVTWGPRNINKNLPVNYFVSSFKEMEEVLING